ncbi:hypothetical protein L9F63_006336, partial [Diploptera punctata]
VFLISRDRIFQIILSFIFNRHYDYRKFKSMNFDIPDDRDLISKFIESTPDGNDISKFVKSTPDDNVIEGDSNEYPLPCLKNMKYEQKLHLLDES